MTAETGVTTKALRSAVEVVGSFVASFEAERYSGPDAASLVEVFSRLERLGVAGKAKAAARAARCHPDLATGHRTPAEWLAATTGDSVGDAVGLLKLGDALKDQPGVDEALTRGTLAPSRARLVSDAVRVNPAAEDDLVRGAGTDTMRQLKDRCLKAKSEGRSPTDEAAHHRRLHQDRRCRTYTDTDGAFRLEAVLAPVAGAELSAVLDTQVDRIFHQARRSGVHETPDAYRADALVALVTGRGLLGPPTRPRKGGGTTTGTDSTTATGQGADTETTDTDKNAGTDKNADTSTDSTTDTDTGSAPTGCRCRGTGATVHVRADLSALRRGHLLAGEVCEIDGVGPISLDQAVDTLGRALCHLVITDGVDVTTICRLGRNIPTPLVLALLERDRTCVVPGCGQTKGLEFDHWQVDFALGGETSLDNLARLCRHHHRLKTHHGYRLVGGPGNWQFLAPESPPPTPRRKRPTRRRSTTGPPPTDPGPTLFTDRE
jgi:hypothetical protein